MALIAASIMCANQLNLQHQLHELEAADVELLHCDVMDGRFVNNLAMGPYVLEQIKEGTSIPLDIHLATESPSKYIEMYAPIQPKYISFHVEASSDVKRDITRIKEKGIQPVLALSPKSPIKMITPYLSMVSMLLIMTVNPGFAGQKFHYSVLEKLDQLKKILSSMESPPLIEVDGSINRETIPLLLDKGADVFVLGTSALFNHKPYTFKEKIESIRNLF